jgi:hypothetical protein
MSSDNIQLRQQPSETLREKIHNCVADFKSCIAGIKKLEDAVKEAFVLGRQEGYTDKEIGDMIRKELAAAGLSNRTITRYLPAEVKRSGGYSTRKDKLSFQNQNQNGAKQLAPDSISEVIVGEESSTKIEYENDNVKAQAQPGIDDKDVEPSLFYSVPEGFKLDLLDQYDKPYLIKVVKYLHKQIEKLVKQLRDKDIKRRDTVLKQ